MVNVLYVLHDTNLGGATRSLLDCLKSIKEKVNPRVIVPGYGPACVELDSLGVPYEVFSFCAGYGPIGKHSENDVNRSFWLNYNCAIQIAKVSCEKGWNLQLIHTNSSVNCVGAMLALILRIPHVWHFREFLEEDFNSEIWDTELQRKLIQSSEKCIAISDSIKEKYESINGITFERIYNGLSIEEYCVKKGKESINHSFYVAGTVQEGKGQAEAIKAVDYLVNDKGVRDISLHIVGYGDERLVWVLSKFIKKRALENNVFIHDFSPDLSDLRRMCTYSLTCSKKEALGRSTIEAMLARKIVVGADTGGTLEIIGKRQEKRGLLYKQGDYVNLAETMLKAMSLSADEYEEYLDNAQSYCVETFDSDNYTNRLINCYEEVLSSFEFDEKREGLLRELESRFKYLDSDNVIKTPPGVKSDKYRVLFYTLMKWLSNNRYKKNVEKTISQKGWKNIAIYGMGYLGRILYDELEESDIKIVYFIDNSFTDPIGAFDVYRFGDDLPIVDGIIVTVAEHVDEIVDGCRRVLEYHVYSIQELLNGELY